MITLRAGNERGHTTPRWLDSAHTFSFDDHDEPRYTGFRQLRVINDDWVKPGAGFGTHAHRDMEILTYVLQGALAHQASTGVGSVMRPGDVQRMSAGTGISHSEYNHADAEPVHFLQIWIVPERLGLQPRCEQRPFAPQELRGRWRLVAARDGREGAVTVHQDVDVLATRLQPAAARGAGGIPTQAGPPCLAAGGVGSRHPQWRPAQSW